MGLKDMPHLHYGGTRCVPTQHPRFTHKVAPCVRSTNQGALRRARLGFLAVVREDITDQNDRGMLRWAASSNLLHLNDEMQENVLEAAGTSFRRVPKVRTPHLTSPHITLFHLSLPLLTSPHLICTHLTSLHRTHIDPHSGPPWKRQA